MDRISVLIFNTLSARQGLSLPGIGDLYVETEPAVMEQAGVVTPPKYRVVLADENSKGLPSVVKLVATVQGTDEEQAKELDAAYEKAIEPLEKALAKKPQDAVTVELLKSVCFRLRDNSPEMMSKFEKYDAMFKSMQQ